MVLGCEGRKSHRAATWRDSYFSVARVTICVPLPKVATFLGIILDLLGVPLGWAKQSLWFGPGHNSSFSTGAQLGLEHRPKLTGSKTLDCFLAVYPIGTAGSL